MSNNKADISQIRKYLEEGLDARARHQLERQALDDPFLMEAMEGFELSGTNPQAALDDLDARLQLRTAKTRRLTPWWAISAAASVVLVLTVGYLFWPSGKKVVVPNATNLSAKATDHPKPQTDTVKLSEDKNLIAANNAATTTQRYVPLKVKADKQAQLSPPASAQISNDEFISNADTKQIAADKPTGVAAAVVPVIDSNYLQASKINSLAKTARSGANFGGSAQRADTVVFARKAAVNNLRYDSTKLKEVVIGYGAKKQAIGSSALNTTLQGKVDGVDVTTPDRIHGTISDIAGLPLPGVSIMIPGTKTGTQTDALGHFTITAADGQTLDIRYIGYASKQVKAKAHDENNIALQPSNAMLNEVAIASVKRVKPDKHAHPREGWDNFNTYLKNAAVAQPDEQEGTVLLSFTVNAQGELKDIKVLKGLTPTMDQRAISLLLERSPWVAEADGTAKTIKLKIRFSKMP